MTPYEQWQQEKYGNYIPERDCSDADECEIGGLPENDFDETDVPHVLESYYRQQMGSGLLDINGVL